MSDGSAYDQEQFVKDCISITKMIGRRTGDRVNLQYVFWGPNLKIVNTRNNPNHLYLRYMGKRFYPACNMGGNSFFDIPTKLKQIILHLAVTADERNLT
jgi:hypothetical protein